MSLSSISTWSRAPVQARRPLASVRLAALWGRLPSTSRWDAPSRASQPSPNGVPAWSRVWRSPALPASRSSSANRSRTGALTSAITPPELLPYKAVKGPRSTSIRAAEARSKCVTCPWPSGIVAGMPSVYRRSPRTPNGARAPKPRDESCRSCA